MKKINPRSSNRKIRVFSSFEDENRAEYERLSRMTPNQRLDEFTVLQKRAWGSNWTKKPIKRIATVETDKW
jgi:hypothetical protein